MKSSYDVAVIGAGVVGASICRQLSKYKIKIALLEKEADVSFGTSKANSGIIHAGFHSPPGTLKAILCIKGNRKFDRLAEELGFSFERRGALVIAFTDEELQILQNLYKQGLRNRVPYLELIGRERVLEMEPNLNPDVLGALYTPSAGIIEPYEYCFALVENAVQNGVDLYLNQKAQWIRKRTFGNFIIETEKGLKISTHFIINAAGLFADEVASYVGITNLKIHPRKGEEYLLDRRVGSLIYRIIFPVPTKKSKGMLIIPTVDGTVMVGPTAEDTDNKEDFLTTRQGLKKVFENAQNMIPSIRSTDVITSFAGLRPVATENDFILGATKVAGFINAAGIQSPGLTASPAIADYIEDVLIKQKLRLVVKRNYNNIRKPFPKLRRIIQDNHLDYFNHYIKNNNAYSKLVCRCENITEAEIIHAIKRGHITIDGIKFATRAGMGRCQGGFCTYRVMKILSRETGLSFTEITKKGTGSELLKIKLNKGLSDDRS